MKRFVYHFFVMRRFSHKSSSAVIISALLYYLEFATILASNVNYITNTVVGFVLFSLRFLPNGAVPVLKNNGSFIIWLLVVQTACKTRYHRELWSFSDANFKARN